MSLNKVADSNFSNFMSKDLTLIKFGASWCGPCKALAPTLLKISEEMSDLSILDLDIDESPKAAQTYRISSVPTLILVKDGIEVSRKIGNMPKSAIESWVKSSM